MECPHRVLRPRTFYGIVSRFANCKERAERVAIMTHCFSLACQGKTGRKEREVTLVATKRDFRTHARVRRMGHPQRTTPGRGHMAKVGAWRGWRGAPVDDYTNGSKCGDCTP